MICGSRQRPGQDYDICASSLILLVAQFDAIAAYPNAPIERPVYVRAPDGSGPLEGKTLKLLRGVYGLKQSGRLWQETLTEFLIFNRWRRIIGDQNIFVRENILLGLYVDDFICVGPTKEKIDEIFKELNKRFPMRNLGPVNEILGMDLIQKLRKIQIAMRGYVRKLMGRHKVTMHPRQPLPPAE